MRKELWVALNGTDSVSLGLLQKGKTLAGEQGLKLCAVLAEKELLQTEVMKLSASGAEEIIHIPIKSLLPQDERDTACCLAGLAEKRSPRAILFEYSIFYGSAAPMLAMRLERGITADCTELAWDTDGLMLQIRPSFGGSRLAYNRALKEPYLATVRRGVFPYREPDTGGTAIPVTRISLPETASAGRILELVEAKKDGGLESAEIIVSGGLGMGSREAFRRLFRLGELIGASVGASRAAVAAGFTSYAHQVGQTGVTVRPRLYLAFGISGAVQHLSGIMNAEKIIAVNRDPKAPIHRFSDYSIYADCSAFLEALIRKLEIEEK